MRVRDAVQAAYRIVVSRATPGQPASIVWDSGQVASAEQAFVAYDGPALAPDTVYRWTVQTWAAPAGPSPLATPPSRPACPTDWRATWITPADTTIVPDQYTYARREFALDGSPIVRARAYVSGDQQYELYVNGTRAGEGRGVQLPGLAVLRDHSTSRGCCGRARANAVGLALRAGRGRPRAIRPASRASSPRSRCCTATAPSRRSPPTGRGGSARARGCRARSATSRATSSTTPRTSTGRAEPVGWDAPGFDDRVVGAGDGARAGRHRAVDASRVRAHPHRRGAGAAGVADPARLGRGRRRLRQGLRRGPDRDVPPRRRRAARHDARRLPARRAVAGQPFRRAGRCRRARHPAHRHELHRTSQRGGGRGSSTRSTTSGSGTSRSTTPARR